MAAAKLESALDRFEAILKKADERLGALRDARYQRILENQKRFMELQRQNDLLISQISPAVPIVSLNKN